MKRVKIHLAFNEVLGAPILLVNISGKVFNRMFDQIRTPIERVTQGRMQDLIGFDLEEQTRDE